MKKENPRNRRETTISPSEEGGVAVGFLFKPDDYVIVKLLGLNYNGRVRWCEYDGRCSYHVEYADDQGKFERRNFFGDELERKVG